MITSLYETPFLIISSSTWKQYLLYQIYAFLSHLWCCIFILNFKKMVQCILCIAVFLILLDNYKSTCPEVERYLLQNHSVTHWNSTFLAEKCWGTGRNVKMSWQYICHCIQWEKEKILKLNDLQTLFMFF